MLPIVEMFYSIQGEGARTGTPSVFIRLGGCNFTCSGFGCSYNRPDGTTKTGCDSWFAVDTKFKNQWNMMDLREITSTVEGLLNEKLSTNSQSRYLLPDIVITGGEPTIHWNDDVFQQMLVYYISRGHKITIETNASILTPFTKEYHKEIIFSMSVKLSNSGEPAHKRINLASINNMLETCPDSFFKFVINKPIDGEIDAALEVEELIKDIPYFTNIYVMPMGANRDELINNMEYVADYAISKGFKYSPREHIIIWNDKKGV